MEGADEQDSPGLADSGREPDQAELEQCPGCYEYKPLSEFCELVADLSHDGPQPHCRNCRENGPPPKRFLGMTLQYREAARALLAAPNAAQGVKDAAQITGFSERHIRQLRDGRRVPEFRRFYQYLLEQIGGDIARVAEVQVDCMNNATEQKWNPKEEEFNEFPDYRTKLRASQHIGKMLEMEPPKKDGITVGVAIKIEHNLGTGETFDPPNVFRPGAPVVDVSHEG